MWKGHVMRQSLLYVYINRIWVKSDDYNRCIKLTTKSCDPRCCHASCEYADILHTSCAVMSQQFKIYQKQHAADYLPNHFGYLCNLWSSCRELQYCHESWTSFDSIVCPCKKGVQWDNYYCINRIWATNADAPYANYKWYIKLTSKSSLGLLFTPHPSSKSRLCTHSNSVTGARFQWNQNMGGWRRWSCDGSLTAPE